LLIPLEYKVGPAPGYERRDVGRWNAESQLRFTHLTLYAPGWSLHAFAVGGRQVMLPWEGGARLSPAAPLTFKINGGPAETIDVELSQPPDVQTPAAPYVVVRPAPYKPAAFPFGQPKRKRRRQRVIVVG
jgi:hypothetical protein